MYQFNICIHTCTTVVIYNSSGISNDDRKTLGMVWIWVSVPCVPLSRDLWALLLKQPNVAAQTMTELGDSNWHQIKYPNN